MELKKRINQKRAIKMEGHMISYDELTDSQKVLVSSKGYSEEQIKVAIEFFNCDEFINLWNSLCEKINSVINELAKALVPTLEKLKEAYEEGMLSIEDNNIFYKKPLRPAKYYSKCKQLNLNHNIKRLDKLYIKGNRIRAYEKVVLI